MRGNNTVTGKCTNMTGRISCLEVTCLNAVLKLNLNLLVLEHSDEPEALSMHFLVQWELDRDGGDRLGRVALRIVLGESRRGDEDGGDES